MTTVDPAGYEARILRDWTVPQGADTVNSLRPYRHGDDGPEYLDLTDGWSARAQMRDRVGGAVWVAFSSTDTEGARIDLDADGWVSVILPAAVTEEPAWDSRTNGVYDVELIDADGHVIRLAKGDVEVSHDVTREVT